MAKEEKNPLAEALAEFNNYEEPKVITLKSKVLNGILNGGLPEGSVIQFAAGSGTGKSTIALDISRELCQQNYKVLYIDAEKGINKSQLKGTSILPYLGNTKKNQGSFNIVKEYDCNKVKQVIEAVCPKNKNGTCAKRLVDCIVLDSIGALDSGIYNTSNASINNIKVGGHTKSIKALVMFINGIAIDYGITFILINHTLKDIGSFFPTEHIVGGDTPKFLSDVVIKLKTSGSPICNAEGVPMAQKVTAEAVKSRLGPGKVKVPFYVLLGKGISNLYTYRDILETMDTEYDGKKVKTLTITAGSSLNHLYLNGQDYTFAKKDDAVKMIAQHYADVDKLIPQEMFLLNNSDDSNDMSVTSITQNNDDELDEIEDLANE